MAAEKLGLDVALRQSAELVLDTCVLIDGFQRTTDDVIVRVPRAARRTTAVAWWEFLAGGPGQALGSDLRARRETWLQESGIQWFDEMHQATAAELRRLLRSGQRLPPGVGMPSLPRSAWLAACP